jgi:2'-5' RNA ligase
MRLFTGVDLPPKMAGRLDDLILRLKPATKVRWSRVENLHITTKFIGEWPEERLDELKSALVGVTVGQVDVQLRGLGWFPNPHAPRIFWMAVDGGEALKELAVRTEDAVARLGVLREKKAYTPHLTLARVDPRSDVAALRQAVARLPAADWGSFQVTCFHLFESQQGPGGRRYVKLADYALG